MSDYPRLGVEFTEMTLAQYVQQLPDGHAARKEYEGLLRDYMAMDRHINEGARVQSNVDAINQLRHRALGAIYQLVTEVNRAHPEYPDTYPKLLKLMDKEAE